MVHLRSPRRFRWLAALTLLAATIVGDPAPGIGPEADPLSTPSGDTQGDDESKLKRSERKFQKGFRAAHQLIQQEQFEAGIAALRALRRDAHPEVANYLGYASRKLGRYEDAKFWYEAALAADPRHARTWAYYGMWHAEQGNVLKAQHYLERIRLICGSECREYLELKSVIEGTRTY
jgi:tetratricopeptide (TPR) repeat protein